MKIFEARALTEQEILAKKRDLKAEYLNLQLQRTTGQVEKPSRFREIRRTIARLETALTEKRAAKNAKTTDKNQRP